MHGGTMMMIHNAWFHCSGDYREMRASADYLEKVSNELAKLYSKKMGIDVDKVRGMLDDETFFTGEEAVAVKLVNKYDGEEPSDDAKNLYRNLNFKKGGSQSYKQFMTAARARKPVALVKRDADFEALVEEDLPQAPNAIAPETLASAEERLLEHGIFVACTQAMLPSLDKDQRIAFVLGAISEPDSPVAPSGIGP
jgi:hypothetical protein